jgi:MinD-like ATPase involved in chromosome partitioning or flagellar assembly
LKEIQIADGFDEPERIAFGLGAPQLGVTVTMAVVIYLLLHTSVTPLLTVPVSLVLALLTACLAWGRYEGRPLLDWAWFAILFYTSSRWRQARKTLEIVAEPVVDVVETTTPTASAPQDWRHWLEAPTPEPQVVASKVVELDRTPLVVLPNATVASDHANAEDEIPSDEEIEDSIDPANIRPVKGTKPELMVADTDQQLYAPESNQAPAPIFVGAARRIAFFSLSGGSGKTTLACEVAAYLANRGRARKTDESPSLPLKVALLDFDLQSASTAIRLGIPQPTLWDYLVTAGANVSLLDKFMVTHSSGLTVLLGPSKPLVTTTMSPEQIDDIVNRLERDGQQFIVFDLARDLSPTTLHALDLVHDIYLVVGPTATGVQDLYRTTEALRRHGLGHKLRYVINRAKGKQQFDEVMSDLRSTITATIPEDSGIPDAENHHRVASLSGHSPAADAIADLAARVYPGLASRRSTAGTFWSRLGFRHV